MPQLTLPLPIREKLVRLEDTGHETALVGSCVRQLISGVATRDFEGLTRAPAEAVLRLFPSAIVTGADARRITLPTEAGPLDVQPDCASVEAALGLRDFTLHAVAYRPNKDAWIDPHGGRADLAARRLRTPGPAKECLGRDPLRALRAARLMAEHGLDLDAELESAMCEQAGILAAMTGRRLRNELELLLLAPGAGEGLRLLRRTGLENAVAPGTRDDAADVVAKLPLDLELRLAGLLRGTRVRAILRRLRCPRDRATRIERILQLHPVDSGTAAAREARARRLARRPAAEREELLLLREAELVEGAPRRGLDKLRRALDRALRAEAAAERRAELALRGQDVMEHLGIGPGAKVGQALRHLAERVAEDPSRNQPAALLALLDAWANAETDRLS